MNETLDISKHSGSNDLTELRNLHAFLNDSMAMQLTNGKIKKSIEIKIKTFEAIVELSLLHPQKKEIPFSKIFDEGFFIVHGKELPIPHTYLDINIYFTFFIADRKIPYLIHQYPLTEEHEKILYKHLKLKIKQVVAEKVTELTWI